MRFVLLIFDMPKQHVSQEEDCGIKFSWRPKAEVVQPAPSSLAASGAALGGNDDDDFDFDERAGMDDDSRHLAAAVQRSRAEENPADSCLPSLESGRPYMAGGVALIPSTLQRPLDMPRTPPRWGAANADVLVV